MIFVYLCGFPAWKSNISIYPIDTYTSHINDINDAYDSYDEVNKKDPSHLPRYSEFSKKMVMFRTSSYVKLPEGKL